MRQVLARIALVLFLNFGLAAATRQFTIQFSASSGNSGPVGPSGSQMVDVPLTIQFPVDFPVNQQTCLNNLGIDSPCKRISTTATATFSPITAAHAPNTFTSLSARVNVAGAFFGLFS